MGGPHISGICVAWPLFRSVDRDPAESFTVLGPHDPSIAVLELQTTNFEAFYWNCKIVRSGLMDSCSQGDKKFRKKLQWHLFFLSLSRYVRDVLEVIGISNAIIVQVNQGICKHCTATNKIARFQGLFSFQSMQYTCILTCVQRSNDRIFHSCLYPISIKSKIFYIFFSYKMLGCNNT